MKEKKLPLVWYTLIVLFFLEFIFRGLTLDCFWTKSLIYLLFSVISWTLLLSFINNLFNRKTNCILYFSLLFLLTFWVVIQFVYKNALNVFFSVSMLKLADQLGSFQQETLNVIWRNILFIIVFFIPFGGLFLMKPKLDFEPRSFRHQLIYLLLLLVMIGVFQLTLQSQKKRSYSAYEIYYKINNSALSVEKFGIFTATYLNLKKELLGFQEKIPNIEPDKQDLVTPPNSYTYNIIPTLDFDALVQQESNPIIKEMHHYFSRDLGTKKNKWTGYFKDKNLILFMAESFNSIAVHKKKTPTFYRLIHSGFDFHNYYTPVNNSTIGGEFQELTGLFANDSILKDPWRTGKNYFPYGIATMFQKNNYQTYAYHNHTYTFQDRNKYLKALGFNNFLGCRNGLEKRIDCNKWPESDVELIEATIADYINDPKFMVFYASVSGHGNYKWTGNMMACKHRKEVADLPYSEQVKAYIAAQIEFDRALELLIKKLQEAGRLDDTVIVFVGDHYPYMLTLAEINEVAEPDRDSVIEVNRSHLVIWNNQVRHMDIFKVANQIDVLPTLYNLFGFEFDSRLFMGKDIFSSEPGLAIFKDRSWVSDYGKYLATSQEFQPNNLSIELPDNYIERLNNLVSARITISKNIIAYDYYRHLGVLK